jgi:hypothetical protein
MNRLVRTVAVLGLALLPTIAHAQEANPSVHPWKQAYARRMAEERLEHRRAREEREAAQRRFEEMRNAGLRPGTGARPARPDESTPASGRTATRAALRPSWARQVAPANTIVNNRSADGSSSGQSETSIAAFGDWMVAAWNDGEGFQTFSDTQGWATSTDGGLTWTDRGAPPKPAGVGSFTWTSDPQVTVNERTGAFYFAALCDFSVGGAPLSGVAVIKGRFNGGTFTWGTPVIARSVDASIDFVDKEWIAADSVTGRVHLTYSRFPGSFSRIEYQRADSNLTAFTTPVAISLNTTTENGWVQGSRPIVDAGGGVRVMYYLIGQGEQDFYRVATSPDGGNTFGAPVTAATVYTNFGTGSPGFNRSLGIQFAGAAVDRSHGPHRGRVYLSWAESINWLDEVLTIGNLGSTSEVETGNTAATATTTTIGRTLRGQVTNALDFDYFALRLDAGQHLIVAADSCSPAATLTLRMFARDGVTRLAYTAFDATVNPTSGNPQGVPSGWMFTAPDSGVYYVRIASFSGTGGYRVRTGVATTNGERGRDQRDVFVTSSDNGTTWSAPVRLSDDRPGFDAFIPEVAVSADGIAWAAWFDYRDSAPLKSGGEASVYMARSNDGGATWSTLGAVTDSLSSWSDAVSNIEPNQGDYLSLFANQRFVWPCWSDARRGNPDVFVTRLALLDLRVVRVTTALRRVDVEWANSLGDTLTARLYRSQDGGAWQYLRLAQFDATGSFALADTGLAMDHTYTYRLGRFSDGVEQFYGQVSVPLSSVFPLTLASPRPNPVRKDALGQLSLELSLAGSGPATITVHDLSGREVQRVTLSAPSPGTRSLPFALDPALPQGLYVVRLDQAGRTTTTRLTYLR